jgi:hypothetical protein
VRVVYSDGTIQSLTGLGDPGTLPPGGGFVLSITFVIPPGAALVSDRWRLHLVSLATNHG